MRLFLIALFFAIETSSAAVVAPNHTKISENFLQIVSLDLDEPAKVEKVIYGNPKVGFFEAARFSNQGKKLKFPVLPPTYQHKVRFYIGVAGGKGKKLKYKRVGAKVFKNPLPKMYQSMNGQLVSGNFSSPFFLVNGSLPRQKLVDTSFKSADPEIFQKDKHRYTFVMILNRLGEVVWVHVPSLDGNYFSSYISSKRISDGVYGLLFGKKAGYFEAVAANGKVLRNFSSRDIKNPFPMHHDFLIASNDVFYVVSSKAGKLKKWGLSGGAPATFLADTVMKVDISKKRGELKYDFLDNYNPARDSFWTGDEPDDKKFVLWGEPKVDFDFLHINSISFEDKGPNKGFLVSLRNISKVMLIDEQFKKVKWTFGSEKRDSFYIAREEDQFLHQHTPVMLDNEHLMLFDNGREEKSSRIVVYRMNDKNGTAKVVWEYSPKPTLFSKNRSSAFPLKNRNILAYFVSPAEAGATSPAIPNRDVLVEVDFETQQEIARMIRPFETLSPGYRAEPLTSIGRESFMGYSLSNQ